MINHNRQKKIAVINDYTGFGRCSMTVALPVISMLKVQCCPVPTSILSNHTGYDSFFFDDYTRQLPAYIGEWKKLDLRFQGILSGFLGSSAQIDIVRTFFQEFKNPDTIIVVDPVMGDHGKPYSTYTREMCEEMKNLVQYANILTPNLTEGCILTDTPYHEGKWKIDEIITMAEKLSAMGPEKVVITGINQGEFIANFCYEKGQEPKIRRTHRVNSSRSGTGDLFASIIAADAVNGVPFQDSVRKASLFVKHCIEKTVEMDIPLTDGVCFEEILYKLK
jgi:pyridoxine kinase